MGGGEGGAINQRANYRNIFSRVGLFGVLKWNRGLHGGLEEQVFEQATAEKQLFWLFQNSFFLKQPKKLFFYWGT